MKFTNTLYINKENLALRATRIAKYSCSGPGKFAVFIILCIIVVATFESLGLTNKERNLDSRKVGNLIKFNMKKHTEELQERISNNVFVQNDALNQKLRNFSEKNIEEKNLERGKMLFSAAVDQFIYESKETKDLTNEEKLNLLVSHVNNAKNSVKKNVIKNDEDYFFDI